MSDHQHPTTSYEEQPLFFPYGDLSLSGVLTLAPEPNGRTVLLTWGPSLVSSAGVNRVRARIARALAAEGYHSFRFDYPGIGESQGTYGRPSRTTPLADEVTGVADWLASAGHDRLLILGNCLGGWSALVAASRIPQLEGMFLVNPPVKRDHKQVRAAEEGWRWWVAGLRKVSISKLRNPAQRAKYRKMLAAKGSAVVGSTSNDQRFPQAVRAVLDRGVPAEDPLRRRRLPWRLRGSAGSRAPGPLRRRWTGHGRAARPPEPRRQARRARPPGPVDP